MSSSMSSSLSGIEAQTIAQYLNTFLDLVDNLPNEISRHLSQLHILHNNYLKLINKMDINIENYKELMENNNNNNTSELLSDNKRRLTKRIESQLIQMQELSDEKLKYAQIIIDLIESKSKELDLDYEEIPHLNQLNGNHINNNCNNTINNSITNKMSAKLSLNSSQIHTNTSSQQSTNSINSNPIEDQKQTINGENSKSIDKRLLPRRACALKPGEMNENNYPILPKMTKQKSINSRTTNKYSSAKSHNFQLSMSNFYRDMARRRAKLPIKIKNKKSVSLALKRNANNRKTVPNSNKNLIIANSGSKDSIQTNDGLYKKNNDNKLKKRNKKSSISSSSSSSTSTISFKSLSQESKHKNETKDEKSVLLLKSNSSQINRKESKRSANDINSSSSINNNNKSSNNKKSKTLLNDSIDNFIGLPIDPNEPLYCLCNQVSFGDMIGCDNKSCQIEWFHFPCVDLVHKPKGKWFCPNCRGDRSNRSNAYVPKK